MLQWCLPLIGPHHLSLIDVSFALQLRQDLNDTDGCTGRGRMCNVVLAVADISESGWGWYDVFFITGDLNDGECLNIKRG